MKEIRAYRVGKIPKRIFTELLRNKNIFVWCFYSHDIHIHSMLSTHQRYLILIHHYSYRSYESIQRIWNNAESHLLMKQSIQNSVLFNLLALQPSCGEWSCINRNCHKELISVIFMVPKHLPYHQNIDHDKNVCAGIQECLIIGQK